MNRHDGQRKQPHPGRSLRISAKDTGTLSLFQRRFNILTDRITKLEKEIQKGSVKFEKLFGAYLRVVQPCILENASMMVAAAESLDGFWKKTELRKSQVEAVQAMILGMCEQAFRIIAPTAEQQAMQHRWSGSGGHTGNPDPTDDTAAHSTRPFGKKSKLQLETAAGRKLEDEVKQKNIRSIYIALAKVLHPDMETDRQLKIGKEELMKQVTSAYAEKDLNALLRLEVEWVRKESLHAGLLTDETLKHYISALEDQMADLKQEKLWLSLQPRYRPVVQLAHLPEARALEALHRMAKHIQDGTANLAQFKNTLESRLPPKDILKHIREYTSASGCGPAEG